MKNEVDSAKLDKGRNVALIRLPGTGDLPAITASMIHELPMFYRVDVPNSRTGEQIYIDVLNHLTYLGDHLDQWPANETDAYRAICVSRGGGGIWPGYEGCGFPLSLFFTTVPFRMQQRGRQGPPPSRPPYLKPRSGSAPPIVVRRLRRNHHEILI